MADAALSGNMRFRMVLIDINMCIYLMYIQYMYVYKYSMYIYMYIYIYINAIQAIRVYAQRNCLKRPSLLLNYLDAQLIPEMLVTTTG